ncbi:4Fe-4S dicluster domain-containing protein [Desulfurivibrio alkaliphilus]|uniref:4Fe-4S ferredoxin iron-sulfur binding domain protein n=1 Tax=Desulfurivibrio alkaliphilus (strain DSM 19089 / UNIQEM U267 / AHT2) TaxID=589865 RepID=D6YZW8_DESAT|nr:4Fe-4S dicluster domain-containing protein [Desulfurivibrio alkaliphilus]ADH85125.1 4Fe-4S ferredoxin iron-sulfur binding domain protein [Desulfurivibrio alkaliphilus AHT 2]
MSQERKKRWVMVVDPDKCIDCKACDVACKRENGMDAGTDQQVYRNWITSKGVEGTYPYLKERFEPSQCQHCQNPPCVKVCPTSASYQTEDGLVAIDYKRCIVCASCILACPYDARYKSPQTKVIDKCTFCAHRIAEGKLPACVDTCPTKVRVFGDLNDPNSEVARLLATRHYRVLKPEQGTKPSLFYLS